MTDLMEENLTFPAFYSQRWTKITALLFTDDMASISDNTEKFQEPMKNLTLAFKTKILVQPSLKKKVLL